MLLGTGKRILQPPPFIRKYLNDRGIQLDVLDTVSLSTTSLDRLDSLSIPLLVEKRLCNV